MRDAVKCGLLFVWDEVTASGDDSWYAALVPNPIASLFTFGNLQCGY